MTKAEVKEAEWLLESRTDRMESCGADTEGGWCLTAHWIDGGQRIFYTLEQVQNFLAEKAAAQA